MKHTLKEWFMVTRPWGYALSIMPAALAVAYVFFENSITAAINHGIAVTAVNIIFSIAPLLSSTFCIAVYCQYIGSR